MRDEYLERLTARVGERFGLTKERVYIDDPAEAPEGVEVQEGEEGGSYYVPAGESDGGDGGEPDVPEEPGEEGLRDMDTQELQELADYLFDQHQAAREARGGQGGRDTDTAMDEEMRETLDRLRAIDRELRRREEE